MRIVIVEDEVMIARRIKMFCENILGKRIEFLKHFIKIEDANEFINSNSIDLLLLDLNLNSHNGYELLKTKVASSFNTIIISANTDRAIEAFEYGVIDFIGKPFTQERLQQAFNKSDDAVVLGNYSRKYLTVKKYGCINMISIDKIVYIRASGHYCELHLVNGITELYDKNLEKLLVILPSQFERVHKSYALPLTRIKKLVKHGGSRYSLELFSGETIPLGRTRYIEIKNKLTIIDK